MEPITKDMRVGSVLKNYPETFNVFSEYNLDCFTCMQAKFETLEQAADVHRFDLDEMLFALNQQVKAD